MNNNMGDDVRTVEHIVELERRRIRRQLFPLLARLESVSLTSAERMALIAELYRILR